MRTHCRNETTKARKIRRENPNRPNGNAISDKVNKCIKCLNIQTIESNEHTHMTEKWNQLSMSLMTCWKYGQPDVLNELPPHIIIFCSEK